MTVDPATSKHRFDYQRRDLSFLLGRLPHQIRRRSRSLSRQGQAAEGRRAGRHDLHLPDASGDPPGRPRKLPDLRHGAGARRRQPRCAAQPRTRRHDAAVLDRPRAGAAGGRAGDGRPSRRRPRLDRSDAVELDSVRVRHARRAVGRLAVLRARLAIAGHAQSQHVHADRDRHRRGLCLQRRRHRRARTSSRRLSAAMAARSRSISRPPPSSPCWCCSARCWNCAPARRRRARSRRCCSSRRRPRAGSATTAPTTRSRSTACTSAIACASGPARRCRWTASSSKAAPRSTNRW